MYEFWLKEKLLLIIRLFQFGLVFIMFTIINLSKLIWRRLILGKQNISEESNLNEIKSAAIAPSSLEEVKDAMNNLVNHQTNPESTLSDCSDELLTTQPKLTAAVDPKLAEGDLTYGDLTCKVDIAPELLRELREISQDPAATIDEAIRWWLRRRTFDILDSSSDRPYRVGMRSGSSKRSQQDLWND